MLTKIAFLLAVVCFSMTFGGIPYTGRSKTGGSGSIPGGDPIPIGPAVIPGGVPMPGGPGMIPGGIGQCEAVTSTHTDVARIAVGQMGVGYNLRRVLGVRTQIVAGPMYYFELHVTNTAGSLYEKCETCDVKVWHQLSGEVSLEDYTCKEVCCY